MSDVLLIISALLVGMVIGLTGIGGGSLMTPILILLFKVAPPIAVATDLFFAAATKVVGTVEYARKKFVDWRIAASLWAGSLPASVITVWLMPENGEFASFIQKVLAFALLLTALVIFLRPRLNRRMNPSPTLLKLRVPLLMLFGAMLGVLVTLSSVGAGALGLALLALFYRERRLAELVATDLAHTVILSLVAGFGHLSADHVDFVLLGKLLIGSIPGVWIGSRLHWHVNEKLIALVLFFVGCWLGYAQLNS